MDKPVQSSSRVDSVKAAEKRVGAVLEHVWDNYLQCVMHIPSDRNSLTCCPRIGDSKNVVLMSYGLGMGAVNHLLKSRGMSASAEPIRH